MTLLKVLGLFIFIVIGVLMGLFYVKVLKKPVFGNLVGAIFVGVIGSVLGGFFLSYIIGYLVKNPLDVDFVSSTIGAALMVWILSKITHEQ